jgi:uncharacterized membrane protein
MADGTKSAIDTAGVLEPGKSNLQLIYILYLAGLIVGITPLIGIVLAYMNKGKATGLYESHYTWAVRTFWIGIAYALLSAVLSILVVGALLAIATAVWWVVRCIVGLQKLGRNEPIAKPQSWLI